MSHLVYGLVRRRVVGSPTRKAVLLLMAEIASDDGRGVWTSKANIARDLEMGKRTVQTCFDDLLAAGLIVEVGTRKVKNGVTIEYDIDLNAVSRLPKTRTDTGEIEVEVRGAGAAPVQEPHPTRAGAAPLPVQEPHPNLPITILEPSKEPLVFPSDESAGGKTRRAVAIPANWVPSDRNISDAQERGFSAEEISHEADQFRDHHLAKGTTFKDWDAGWRTWLGNARKFGNRGMARATQTGGRGQGGSLASIAARRWASGSV